MVATEDTICLLETFRKLDLLCLVEKQQGEKKN